MDENNREKNFVSTVEINFFLDSIARAKTMGVKMGEHLPSVEAPRKLVEYYNPNNIQGFDEVGYFTFNGVNVYEEGKKEEALAKDALTIQQVTDSPKK